ncbi:hypothetical protein [Chryseobacterium aureum]|uniref:hypothetical protein n=1 Tax=Chryseobacterium aureum TaxID=2497456 RepID=UPI000F89224C|nr:hypothetical protein [Chryseobacterium aureum]
MNKDELLKIYSAYLPYGLLIETRTDEEIKTEGSYISKLTGVDHLGLHDEFANCWEFEVRPILYDLSYLTKEIEHGGEKFVPIVELLKIKYPNQKGRYATTEYSTFGYPFACFSVDAGKQIKVNTSYLLEEPFWIFQKITEWHFNAFNLPEDQFINKATLKQ